MMNVIDQAVANRYALYHGDSVEITKEIPDNSIHYTIFSPPFSQLYVYSNSDRDMGNCKGDEEFYNHFKYLAKELYRITMPGRLLSFHCMDLPLMKSRDGVIGLKDFPALMLKIFQDCGFIYHSKVTIWKNPVTEMQRTKALLLDSFLLIQRILYFSIHKVQTFYLISNGISSITALICNTA